MVERLPTAAYLVIFLNGLRQFFLKKVDYYTEYLTLENHERVRGY